MDTLWYKLTYPQGSIYIYNLIPCELFLSIRMVFCAGKKSYFCSQMDSSDKAPAWLYTFCPMRSGLGRTTSCRCTGSLPWVGCWEVRKHTSGVPPYRCCQTHSWKTVQSRYGKNPYIHIYAYTCTHRILHSLAYRRLRHIWWGFLPLSSPFLCLPFHFFEALKMLCNSDRPIWMLYEYKWKKELVPLSYLQM